MFSLLGAEGFGTPRIARSAWMVYPGGSEPQGAENHIFQVQYCFPVEASNLVLFFFKTSSGYEMLLLIYYTIRKLGADSKFHFLWSKKQYRVENHPNLNVLWALGWFKPYRGVPKCFKNLRKVIFPIALVTLSSVKYKFWKNFGSGKTSLVSIEQNFFCWFFQKDHFGCF